MSRWRMKMTTTKISLWKSVSVSQLLTLYSKLFRQNQLRDELIWTLSLQLCWNPAETYILLYSENRTFKGMNQLLLQAKRLQGVIFRSRVHQTNYRHKASEANCCASSMCKIVKQLLSFQTEINYMIILITMWQIIAYSCSTDVMYENKMQQQ